MKSPALLLLCALCCAAETRTLTLKQALDLALQQNPDLVIARLEQQRARNQVTIARDPFSPKVFAGSGAAWTYGFPTSIDGQAPSIMEARTSMSLFDRPQSYLVASASESLRGTGFDITTRQEEAAYRVASLYLDAQNASLGMAAAQREQENLVRVQQLVEARVKEGRELAHEANRAQVDVLRSRQRVESLGLDLTDAESSLALALGLGPGDRVQPAAEEPPTLAAPAGEDAAIAQALANSPEVKRLESNLQAKLLEVKSYKAEWLPKVDLVAQYSLLAKYNNFQEFFSRFQRNNVELGASFSVPVLAGHSGRAYAAQAQADAEKVRVEINRTRGRIAADLRRAYEDIRRAETARELARADLDLARDQVSIDLAQMGEGRLPAAKAEQDRAIENEKWLAFYEADTTAERARLNVLHQTGALLAALNK
ncbi:MAG TPA: TolC family protein [Bryobacteraceae bacterium]|jgi:outer membrane protein TolC